MPHPTIVVKIGLGTALRQSSLRSLLTVAHYSGLPFAARVPKPTAITHIQTHLLTPAAREHLRSVLTPSDRTLFWALLAARDVDLPPTLRRPWQLAAPWPNLADLHPLERLMALGCLVPVRTPRGLRVLIPEQLAAYLPPAASTPDVALPSGPTLTTMRADALVLLGCLAVGRTPPPAVLQHPEQQPRLRAALQHTGLIVATAEGLAITPAAAVFVGLDAARQSRMLLAALTAAPPSTTQLIAGWWPGIVAWCRAILARWGAPVWPITALVEAAEAADAFAHIKRAWCGQVVRDQLVPTLYTAGILRTDGVHAQLTADGLAWATDQPLPIPTPRLPRLGLMMPLPAEAPAMLAFTIPQWAEPHGAGWRFTPASLAAGVARCGATQPLRTVLSSTYPTIPAALLVLMDRADQPPAVRLITPTLLDVATPAILDDLLQQPGLARWITRRLSPTTAQVAPHAIGRVTTFLRRRGLLASDAAPVLAVDGAAVLRALALRIAAASQPTYAAAFSALAHAAARALTLAEQTDLDDQWYALARRLAPQETAADEPLDAGDAPPMSTLDRRAVMAALRTAMTNAALVTIRYYAATTHTISTRTIRPLELRGDYLRAHCQRATAERTFHLGRILSLEDGDLPG